MLAESRLFDLQHRRAGTLATTLREALGGEARVVAVGNSLLVTAPAGELALADELITRLDRPARMLRVHVAQDLQNTQELKAAAGSVVGGAGGATVMVGSGAPPAPPTSGGATVIVGGDSGMLVGSGSAGSRVATRRAEQFLVTLEGAPARISVGKRLPFSERWLVLAGRHAQVVETTRYESVDTGFEVRPELLPDNQVELTIRPFMAFVALHRDREIHFRDLETRVVVPLATWFDLGGTMSDRDEVSREILGAAQGRLEEGGGVRIRVELQAQ